MDAFWSYSPDSFLMDRLHGVRERGVRHAGAIAWTGLSFSRRGEAKETVFQEKIKNLVSKPETLIRYPNRIGEGVAG